MFAGMPTEIKDQDKHFSARYSVGRNVVPTFLQSTKRHIDV